MPQDFQYRSSASREFNSFIAGFSGKISVAFIYSPLNSLFMAYVITFYLTEYLTEYIIIIF